MDMGGGIGHVEQRQQSGGMPCRARGQFVTLQQDHIIPAGLGQMIGNRGANSPAPDNQCFDLRFHSRLSTEFMLQ